MKIPAVLSTALAVLLAFAPVARTLAQEGLPGATFDLFYNNLADDGDWYNTPEYGNVWQPNIAGVNSTWRPYADGYWAQTDNGWTWVSYESFGWATYHYGRWTRLNDLGWAWVPGYDWGPGWVSWRTNNDFVGWAPLPPQEIVGPGIGVAINYNDIELVSQGYTPAVDVAFDIGPQNYCFVSCVNFGAPVLSEVLLPPQQNFTIIQNTINVTNIYYNQVGGQTVVYNRGGPDYNFISTRVSQPIQYLRLQPNTDPNYLRGNHPPGFNPTQVHNGVLLVAAPPISRAPVNFQQMKPLRVKATLPKAQVVHGWTGVSADPQAIEQAREKFKQQAQAVPKREPNGNIPMPARPTSKTPSPAAREQKAAAAPAPVKAPVAPVKAPVAPAAAPHQAAEPTAFPEPERVVRPVTPAPVRQPAERPAPARPNLPVVAPNPRPEQHTPEPKPAAERPPEPKPAAERPVEHTPEPKPAAERPPERPPEPKPAAERPPERPPEPKPAAERPPEPKPAAERPPEPKPAAERPPSHTPEPKPMAERPPERAPEVKATPAHAPEAKPTPTREERAKEDAARRDEAAKQSEDEKKKKDTPPQ